MDSNSFVWELWRFFFPAEERTNCTTTFNLFALSPQGIAIKVLGEIYLACRIFRKLFLTVADVKKADFIM